MDRHPNAVTDSFDVEGVEAGQTDAPHRIETDRLVLHRVHPEDVTFDRLHALFSDVEDSGDVFELCGWDSHGEESATRAYLDDRVERWGRGAFFEYVLEAEDEYVGTACLEIDDGEGAAEFGLWLCKPHWGRGFSSEATDALVHVAFECLDAPFVVAGCLPDNERSRHAIESFVGRYGGAYVVSPPTVPSRCRGDENEVVEPHHEWTITRKQFDSGENGLSTLIPGVTYDDVSF